MAPLFIASLITSTALLVPTPRAAASMHRRDALVRAAAAVFPVVAASPGLAYDSLPQSAAAPDPAALAAEREKKKRERLAKAAKKNTEVTSLCDRVTSSQTPAEFVESIDALSLWVISQGAPRPKACQVGTCQWLTAEDGSPLPEGFKTRELVTAVKGALKALPQIPYACEMTRENKGVCYNAGPQAESAYQAFLSELKKRAPLQYDTPYGLVSF